MAEITYRAESVHGLLEAAASAAPDAIAVSFFDGLTLTRGQLLAASRQVAGGLAHAGIGPGDRVAMMVGNRLEFLTTFLAISSLGAVSVPLNTGLRGDVLAYMLGSVGPCSLVVDGELTSAALPAVAASGEVGTTWCLVDQGASLPTGTRSFDELLTAPPLGASHPSKRSDPAAILFTSGTTGRSKGVIWGHRMAVAFCENATWSMGYTSSDTVYTCLPLFHINALFTAFFAGLQQGAPVVVSSRFSASRYWTEIGDSGATVTNMLGAIGAILWKQAPTPQERAHRLRLAMVVPFPSGHHEAFERRFGTKITELYGSTDTGIPVATPADERRPGSCGVVAPGWEVALVDENDDRVPPGTPGELVTRPVEPWVGQLGYWQQLDKSWEAHRNLWFHTGDTLVQDADGWFYFQDRMKDALRVSGENVSSFEVERVVITHPQVAEAAVFAVPSEMGEDSIMLAVVPERGATLDPAELIEFVSPRLAYFAVPRYVDVVSELPKTQTQKIQKGKLRERGISAGTWDSGPRRRGQTPRA